MTQAIVFDIGANDGRDTAFYLAKGFHVVAVDADPRLCDQIRTTQAQAIADGRVTVENVGVARHRGVMPFYVNAFSEWSSFRAKSKATTQNTHTRIDVPVCPLADLIARHGVPYYLKVDIEGLELEAFQSLDPGTPMPAWVSFEVNQDWQTILTLLAGWGYGAFQLVRQGAAHLPPPPIPAREGRDVAQAFTNGHSGCFGRDLPDRWQGAADLRATLRAAQDDVRARVAQGQPGGWFDIHARLG